MAVVRSAQLWSFTGNANSIQRSPAVPAGHRWILKHGTSINNSGSSGVDVALGVTLAAGWDIALAENVATGNGGIVAFSGAFFVLQAGDKLFLKTNNVGTCRVVFSGADLVL